jgi:hypothetical protein
MLPDHLATRVLVAEDPFINTFLRTVLQRHGYKVVTSEVSYASTSLSDGSVKADVLITNSPVAFLPFADRLPLLYIAANPDTSLAERFRVARVLRKPFRNEELLTALDELSHSDIP